MADLPVQDVAATLRSEPSPQHATVAHALPLVLFMIGTEAANWLRVENSALPWWRSAPEHWVYPLQCLLVGGVLIAFRRHYTLRPWRGIGLALALAVIGIAIWIAPAGLGWMERLQGFNPDVFADHSAAWWTTIVLRMIRLVIIVPLVEELFWRGFLTRYVQAEGEDWRRIPFGRHTWLAFAVVTGLVTFVHQMPDWPAAFAWGSLVYLLAVKTKSLGACVVMHAAANLILGLYILLTKQWGFW